MFDARIAAWLVQPATLVAVYIPLFAALALAAAAAAGGRLTWRHLGLALVLVPPSYLLSWHTDSGVHVVALFGVAALFLAKRGRMTGDVAYSLTYLSCLAVDVAYAARLSVLDHGAITGHFYQGVGGMGVFDALVSVPLVAGLGAWGVALEARFRTQGRRAPARRHAP